MSSTIIELELSLIVRDPEIQPREVMNTDTIVQYAEDMLNGVEFPPVVVYFDGDRHWLSQGFHRSQAAEDAGLATVAAEVRDGTRQDALWDAACSNREHDRSGLRRTNSDKRRAVYMALNARPKLSDRRIADQVGVGKHLVGDVRRSICPNHPDREVARNGTTYTMKTDGIGRPQGSDAPESESSADDEAFRLIPPSIADEVKPSSRATFNATNEMVDWARWTWNPVTGCEHNCVYCYARDIANRFYPEKFEPTFRPERLDAPRHARRPIVADDVDPVKAMAWRNVFVCSMADLFGRWVPDDWINAVFDSCRRSPEWNYLFLTKFPQRYVGLDFPPTAWVGTSVDEQKRVTNAEKAFARIESPVKWLSVEPMRERIVFKDLGVFDWVVIGGQSRSSGAPEFHPEWPWVFDLALRARDAGCKVYLKPNTFPDGVLNIKEYPY
jgi:protein gp37